MVIPIPSAAVTANGEAALAGNEDGNEEEKVSDSDHVGTWSAALRCDLSRQKIVHTIWCRIPAAAKKVMPLPACTVILLPLSQHSRDSSVIRQQEAEFQRLYRMLPRSFSSICGTCLLHNLL